MIILCVLFQSSELSVFETNIRFVGGLLSLYALTGDKVSLMFIKSMLTLKFIQSMKTDTFSCISMERIYPFTLTFHYLLFKLLISITISF